MPLALREEEHLQRRLNALEELTRQIKRLPEPELMNFCEWFDVYREAARLTEDESIIGQAQEQELRRRQSEYLADRSSASPRYDGFFDGLRQHLGPVQK